MEGLTLLFIGLRICEVITWPWLLVLSPMLSKAVTVSIVQTIRYGNKR